MTSRRAAATDAAEASRQSATIVKALERSHDPACECHATAKAGHGVTHCPCTEGHSHGDEHPSFVVNPSDNGKTIKRHCRVGCKKEDVTAALTSMGLLQPTRFWVIRDADGAPLAEHHRHDFADKPKTMPFRLPGATSWGLNGLAPTDLLYGLEQLKRRPGDFVVITEGEKAADALIDRGFLTVGTVSGAGNVPSLQALSALKDRAVKMWPDNDDAGRQHMDGIGKVLGQLGIVPTVVHWLEAPHTGDAADFVGDADAVRVLLDAATPWKPAEDAVGPIGRLASEFEMRPIAWLWDSRLALGMLTMLDGDPGIGKSSLVADWIGRITTGTAWPDGAPNRRGSVIYVGVEDSVSQVLRPRLQAAGADLTKVLIVGSFQENGKERLLSIPEDLPLLEAEIKRVGALMVVIDPIMSYLSKKTNPNSDMEVRQALTPMANMLDRVGCAGLLLRHMAKNDKVANAQYRGLGSIGFGGVCRTTLVVSKVPKMPGLMTLMLNKTNIGITPPARRYRIEGVDLGHGIKTARIVWGDAARDDPDQLLTETGRDENKLESAVEFLQSTLATGPRVGTEVEAMAKDEDIAPRTLRRAREKLRIPVKPEGFKGQWMWQLPPKM